MINSEHMYIPAVGEHILYNTASSGEVLGVCCGYRIEPPYEASDAHVRFFVDIADPMTPDQGINCRFLSEVRAASEDTVNEYFMRVCIPDIKQRDSIVERLLRMGFKR